MLKTSRMPEITSKNNPADVSQAREFFSAITGIPYYKEIIVKTMGELRNRKTNKLRYKADQIRVLCTHGLTIPYQNEHGVRFDKNPSNIPVYFIVSFPRPLNEFNIQYKECGQARICDGGGSYHIERVYVYKKFYFTI